MKKLLATFSSISISISCFATDPHIVDSIDTKPEELTANKALRGPDNIANCNDVIKAIRTYYDSQEQEKKTAKQAIEAALPGSKAGQQLLSIVKNRSNDCRETASILLGVAGLFNKLDAKTRREAVDGLFEVAQFDDNGFVQGEALFALGKLGLKSPEVKKAIPFIMRIAGGRSIWQITGIQALGFAGVQSPEEVLKFLVELLPSAASNSDFNYVTGRRVVEAIAVIGENGYKADAEPILLDVAGNRAYASSIRERALQLTQTKVWKEQ